MHLWKCFLSGIMFLCVSIGGIYGAFACNAGEYDNDGSCETCPDGYWCDGTNAQQCPNDEPYSNPEHTQCVACDDLTDYIDNGVCKTCESNTFANANHTGCIACAMGHYMVNGVCTVCPAGSYCSGDGVALSCQGAEISDTGADACTQCDGETPYSNPDHTQCVACDGLTDYSVDNAVCQTCESGKFANENHTGCIACTAGYYMVNGDCTACPAGAYCSGDGTSVSCSAGTCSATMAESCKECKAGYYCPDSGMGGVVNNDVCQPNGNNTYICPKGTYSGNGALSCVSCPSGTTTNGTGKINSDDCISVPINLSFGDNDNISIPSMLTVGKINTSVVKNVYQNN